MRPRRTIPPAAAPLRFKSLLNGLLGVVYGQREVERFRDELKRCFGVKHCFLVSSGKAGLALILQALHAMHPDRDEVMIPAFCCYSVPSAVAGAGLKLRLCDVNPETLDYNYDELDERLNALSEAAGALISKPDEFTRANRALRRSCRLLAVISVHLFGVSSNVLRIRERVRGMGVTVVEDAAQVMGARFDGRPLGTLGDVGFYSLGRGKAFSTVEGGVILTDQDSLAESLRLQIDRAPRYNLREQLCLMFSATALVVFQRPSFFWFPKLLPFLRVGDTIYDPDFKVRRFSAFQAGLARGWSQLLQEYSNKRQSASALWASAVKPGVFSHYADLNDNQHAIFIRFPIRVQSQDLWHALRVKSEREGLGIMLTYPDAVNGIERLKSQLGSEKFPGAKKLAQEILTLPVHPFLSRRDKARVNAVLNESNIDHP